MRTLTRNEKQILELIRRSGNLARVEVGSVLEMTGASVTRLTRSLTELGLLVERVERSGEKGQPRKLLSLAPGSHYSAGINFSLNRIEISLADSAFNVVDIRQCRAEGATPNSVAETAAGLLNALLNDHDIGHEVFLGTGISFPGNFGTYHNLIEAHSLFQSFDERALFDAFSTRIEGPVWIENDGSAAALGELFAGQSRERHNSIFFLHLGYGIGGGAIVDGQMFRGAHGNSCLPGVLYPYGEPRPSAQDLIDYLDDRGQSISGFADLTALSEDGRSHVTQWVARAADQLVLAVRSVSGFLDPEAIIIGGHLPEEITQSLVEQLNGMTIQGPSRNLTVPPILASKLGPKAGSIGAAFVPTYFRLFAESPRSRADLRPGKPSSRQS